MKLWDFRESFYICIELYTYFFFTHAPIVSEEVMVSSCYFPGSRSNREEEGGEDRGRGLCVLCVWVQDAFLFLLSISRICVLLRWQLEQTTSHLDISFFIISRV